MVRRFNCVARTAKCQNFANYKMPTGTGVKGFYKYEIKVLLLIFIKLMVWNFDVEANERQILIFTEVYHPYQFYNDKGDFDGFATAFIREILVRAKVKSQIQVLPWARAYKMARKTPNSLIFSIARIPIREKHFIWGKILAEERYYTWWNSKYDYLEAKNKKFQMLFIPVTRDSVVDHFLQLKGHQRLIRTPDFQNTLNLIRNKRADALIATKHDVERLFQSGDEKLYQGKEIELLNAPLYFAFNKNTEQALIDSINDAYLSYLTTKDYRELIAEWGIDGRIHMNSSDNLWLQN